VSNWTTSSESNGVVGFFYPYISYGESESLSIDVPNKSILSPFLFTKNLCYEFSSNFVQAYELRLYSYESLYRFTLVINTP
jgi:hypothetical protein